MTTSTTPTYTFVPTGLTRQVREGEFFLNKVGNIVQWFCQTPSLQEYPIYRREEVDRFKQVDRLRAASVPKAEWGTPGFTYLGVAVARTGDWYFEPSCSAIIQWDRNWPSWEVKAIYHKGDFPTSEEILKATIKLTRMKEDKESGWKHPVDRAFEFGKQVAAEIDKWSPEEKAWHEGQPAPSPTDNVVGERVRKPMVYIAGPISQGNQFVNCREAINWWWRLLKNWNVTPVCPQTSFALEMGKPHSQVDLTHQEWLDYDFQIIERCDAVLRIPGPSKGADEEVRFANSKGIPVFIAAEGLLNWRKQWKPAPMYFPTLERRIPRKGDVFRNPYGERDILEANEDWKLREADMYRKV